MNKLNRDRQVQVVKALVEGNGINGTVRMTGVAKNTILKLLADLGAVCLEYQDRNIRDLKLTQIQCDEIWEFCYAKEKNVPAEHKGQFGYGDIWTFIAIDAETKLVPCWMVGYRDAGHAFEFIDDLRQRLANRVQLTTDGHKMYLEAVEGVFGANIDYAMLVKLYGQEPEQEKRYSPAKCIGANKQIIQGNPDMRAVSTSYVERQNLTMRMSMKRFTRLTNGFSKKVENHMYAIALHFMYYNFARPHKTLANPYPRTPAMASGLTNHMWTVEEIVNLLSN
ncbi:IS1 family transposase [Candidatus Omnitrophota bacterium]